MSPIAESPEIVDVPQEIKRSSPTTTTTTSTTQRPSRPKSTPPSFFTTSSNPPTTTRGITKVITSHHFPVNSSPDIRFNPEEINISLNAGLPPDISKSRVPISFQQQSFSEKNTRVTVTTHTTITKNEKPQIVHLLSTPKPQNQILSDNSKQGSATQTPNSVVSYGLTHNQGVQVATPTEINYGFTYQQTEDNLEYHTDVPPHPYQYQINIGSLRPPTVHGHPYHTAFHTTTKKPHKVNIPVPTTYRSHPVYSSSRKPEFESQRTDKPPRLQLPLPLLPTLSPLTFSSPAPFGFGHHIETKRYTNDHQSPPRIIISASASVSDNSGRRLNYSLGTIGATHLLGSSPSSYDDYKEEDVALDPFYLDVPKVKNSRHKRETVKGEELIKNEEEATDLLRFLFTWFKNHENKKSVSIPVTPEEITEINKELAPLPHIEPTLSAEDYQRFFEQKLSEEIATESNHKIESTTLKVDDNNSSLDFNGNANNFIKKIEITEVSSVESSTVKKQKQSRSNRRRIHKPTTRRTKKPKSIRKPNNPVNSLPGMQSLDRPSELDLESKNQVRRSGKSNFGHRRNEKTSQKIDLITESSAVSEKLDDTKFEKSHLDTTHSPLHAEEKIENLDTFIRDFFNDVSETEKNNTEHGNSEVQLEKEISTTTENSLEYTTTNFNVVSEYDKIDTTNFENVETSTVLPDLTLNVDNLKKKVSPKLPNNLHISLVVNKKEKLEIGEISEFTSEDGLNQTSENLSTDSNLYINLFNSENREESSSTNSLASEKIYESKLNNSTKTDKNDQSELIENFTQTYDDVLETTKDFPVEVTTDNFQELNIESTENTTEIILENEEMHNLNGTSEGAEKTYIIREVEEEEVSTEKGNANSNRAELNYSTKKSMKPNYAARRVFESISEDGDEPESDHVRNRKYIDNPHNWKRNDEHKKHIHKSFEFDDHKKNHRAFPIPDYVDDNYEPQTYHVPPPTEESENPTTIITTEETATPTTETVTTTPTTETEINNSVTTINTEEEYDYEDETENTTEDLTFAPTFQPTTESPIITTLPITTTTEEFVTNFETITTDSNFQSTVSMDHTEFSTIAIEEEMESATIPGSSTTDFAPTTSSLTEPDLSTEVTSSYDEVTTNRYQQLKNRPPWYKRLNNSKRKEFTRHRFSTLSRRKNLKENSKIEDKIIDVLKNNSSFNESNLELLDNKQTTAKLNDTKHASSFSGNKENLDIIYNTTPLSTSLLTTDVSNSRQELVKKSLEHLNEYKPDLLVTNAPLSKSVNPTRAKYTKILFSTTPLTKFVRVELRKDFQGRRYTFNCFDKEINQFYSDARDCRLFHYCTSGYTTNQLVDMKFVCDLGTYFDDENLVCTKTKPARCL